MKFQKRHIVSVLFILLTLGLSGQQKEAKKIETDTISIRKKIQLLGVPLVFYTPETNFGFGLGAQVFFLNQTNVYNSRLSNVFISGIYTTKNQLMLEARPQIYFNAGNLFLDGYLKYRVFPNSFWGIGNYAKDDALEEYNMKSYEITVALLKRLPPTLNFGLEYKYENHSMLEVAEGGLLAAGDIAGSEGAIISGLSLMFNLDTRDNVNSTIKGALIQMKSGFSSRVFGSTYSFNKYTLDIRKYFKYLTKNTLALQFYGESTYGNVPFQSMAWLGGGEKMRGYFKGRYMDKSMYVLQGEYRARFHPRWTAAGFGSIGEVADFPLSFFENPKISFGGGIRFKILKNNPTVVRFDIGFDKNGNNGIYFGVNEAF